VRAKPYLIAFFAGVLGCWVSVILGLDATAHAESGHDAWLRYEPMRTPAAKNAYKTLPATIVVSGTATPIMASARDELARGLQRLLAREVRVAGSIDREAFVPPRLRSYGVLQQDFLGVPREGAFLIGDWSAFGPHVSPPISDPDGFLVMRSTTSKRGPIIWIVGGSDRGVLYGVFAVLRHLAVSPESPFPNRVQRPSAPLRWVDEWNNLDGSIERGYGGRSIFFAGGEVRQDLTRAGEYARLLASVGINAVSINNVNANTKVISNPFLPSLARVAAAFRPWGVRLAVAVDFSSPRSFGGLDTFDPLDPRVAAFWRERIDAIYRAVPDFAGVVLKADSEGRLGPSAYGRTHADAANVIARALAPHGGVIFYRGFVYDHHMDWRNLKNDRARAAWDNFHELDGTFDDNVVLQIKHGPIDFQAREPASPLFGALKATNQAIELQVTQEYTGQQRHVCFLIPMWKEVLDFDLQANGPGTPVKALVSGAAFKRPIGGYVAVSNVGLSPTWLGHDLAMANLYGYGRLAWNPDLTAAQIADEWTRQTFGHEPQVVKTVTGILLDSWPAYERYTGPLGAQTMTDIVGPHFGPAVEASERNGWGQWHRADEKGIGMDRTVATGTGFIGQYAPPVAAVYESLNTCPDELLLFMHHVPYTYVLHSGKSVIQHIYDVHYEGAEEASGFCSKWRSLKGLVDDDRYSAVLKHLEYQAGHAVEWRDAINSWFLKTSGIPDEKGRAGHYPGRVEAESMTLKGYAPIDVTPWESASGGKGVQCTAPGPCTVSTTFNGAAGSYTIIVRYFDENDGASRFEVRAGDTTIDSWTADDTLPTKTPNGHSSTWRVIKKVPLSQGDVIQITGLPDGEERAAIDYIEIAGR
jgi:alpha-glucuronidase